MTDTPLKVLSPEAMRGFARFAIGAFYLGIAIKAFFAFSEVPPAIDTLAFLISTSAILMWCVVDSFSQRTALPYGLWWCCLTPLWIFPVVPYLFRTRGASAMAKALLHAALTLIVAVSFAALGAMWL